MQKTEELRYTLGGLETVKNVQNVSKSIGFLGTTCFIIDLSIIHEIIKSKAVKLRRISEMCKIQQLRMFGGPGHRGICPKCTKIYMRQGIRIYINHYNIKSLILNEHDLE